MITTWTAKVLLTNGATATVVVEEAHNKREARVLALDTCRRVGWDVQTVLKIERDYQPNIDGIGSFDPLGIDGRFN